MKLLTILLISSLGIGCQNLALKKKGLSDESVLNYCLQEIDKRTGAPLSLDADRAYLQHEEKGYFVIFTHGALGAFGKRSLDYRLVISCAIVTEPEIKLVYLGHPLEQPLVAEPEMNLFGITPAGSTEILFKRVGGQFKYCCSQPFDEKNIDRHNPNFPWNSIVE